MKIKQVSPQFIFSRPEFESLCEKYTKESGVKLLGDYNVSANDYRGTHFLGVFDQETLVGFVCLREKFNLHFRDKRLVVVDGVYIEPSFRKGAIGIRLLEKAKELANSLGAVALMIDTPYGSRLSKLMRLILGQEPVSEVFMVGVNEPFKVKGFSNNEF